MASAPSPAAETPAAAPSVLADPRDRFFCTDAVTKDLKRRTIRGGAVTLSAQGVKFALRLGSTAVLARLLTPADFGLIAMVTVVTGFVEMFKDAGLSMATVQRERITHAQVSTLFWINVALSALIMLVIAALAPAIAWFYGEPRLLPITLALSGTMIFGGLAVQHQALLRRQMQFGRLAAIEITSMAAGVATAILMAWHGYTYWSLVAMTAATAATTALMSLIMSGWVPGVPVRGSGVWEMLKFGGNVAGFGFVNYFSRNGDNLLIGWWWGAGPLGLYSKAYGLLMMPITQLNAPISSVAIPMLARLQNQPEQFRQAFGALITGLALATMPGVAALIIVSDAVIALILGEQWSAAAPIFAALGATALIQSVYNTTGWILIALGQGERYFRMGFVIVIPTLIAFGIGLPFGPLGVAISYSAANVLVACPLLFWYVTRQAPVRMTDFYVALYPPLLASAVVAIILVSVRIMLDLHDACLLVAIALTLTLPCAIVAVLRSGILHTREAVHAPNG